MRIGIIIAASRSSPYHSVFQVVKEQIEMIHAAGHVPVLIAPLDLKWPGAPGHVSIRPILPLYQPVKYLRLADLSREHSRVAQDTGCILTRYCIDLDVVFTHDILYLGKFLPLAQGLRQAIGELPHRPHVWLHWIHSIPGEPRDFWTLPPRSLLVHPNEAHRALCADRFGVQMKEVLCVPHARDPRSCLLSTAMVRWMAGALGLLQAEFVQTYPVPTGRMQGKGLHQLIGIFAALHKLGHSTRLIVANSPSDASDTKRVNSFMKFAIQSGLPENSLVFCSTLKPPSEIIRDEAHCLSSAELCDLRSLSNIFICPSKSESFGLALAEAALSGQLLVLNADTPALAEIAGPSGALYFHFGSARRPAAPPGGWTALYQQVARAIHEALGTDRVFHARTRFRLKYNRRTVWNTLDRQLSHRLRLAPAMSPEPRP